MSRKLADFHKKLKDLCVQHGVWLKSVKVDGDRPKGVSFVTFELSAKDEEQEGEQILLEAHPPLPLSRKG